ncbi:MAG: hypothetical protein JO048_17295 [Methylobacteriaceae bacterium]|nr:hypothetical protein [Methylobacteriaceae bacterium]
MTVTWELGIAPPFRRGERWGPATPPVSGLIPEPSRRPSSRAAPGAWRGRPHEEATVTAVRRMIELTCLTYGEIAARAGVGRASVCRWTRAGGWTRPQGAPLSTDLAPSAPASALRRARDLHRRALAVAERIMADLESDPNAHPDTLAAALHMLQVARLEARPKRPRSRSPDASLWRRPPPPPRINGEPGRLPSPHKPETLRRHRAFLRALRERPARVTGREARHLRLLEPERP